MSDVLNETIKSLLGESAPKTTNADAIRSTINNNEFLNFLNVTPSEILDQVKIAEKDYKDLVKYISEYKGDFGSLYNELGGWNLQDEDTTQIVDNLFDCYYGCLLVTIKVNYGKLSVSPTDVYVYPSNITMVDSDELFHLDMGVPIDYSKFTDILPENNTVKEEANNIQEAKNEDLGEVVKVFKSDDGLAVKIIKAPNGKFFNEYYSDINDAHYSGTSGPFKSVKDAEKMVHKHRPTVKEINITESEEVSKDGKSCRHAINENATVVKEDDTIPVEFPEAKANETKDMMRDKMDDKQAVDEAVNQSGDLAKDILNWYSVDMGTFFDVIADQGEDAVYENIKGLLEDAKQIQDLITMIEEADIDDETAQKADVATTSDLVSRLKALLDDKATVEEAKVIKQPKSEEEKTYEMVKHNYGNKAADDWYQFNKCAGDTVKKYVKAKAEEAKKLREAKRTVGDILDEIEEAESIGDIIEICENMKDEVNKGVIRNEIDAIYIDYPDADDIDSDDYDEALENLKNCIIDDFEGERDLLDESKTKYDELEQLLALHAGTDIDKQGLYNYFNEPQMNSTFDEDKYDSWLEEFKLSNFDDLMEWLYEKDAELECEMGDICDESKKVKTEAKEKTDLSSLQDEVEAKIRESIYKHYINNNVSRTDVEDIMKNRITVRTRYEDYDDSEAKGRFLIVEVCAEVDKQDLADLASDLDDIVKYYDSDAYFTNAINDGDKVPNLLRAVLEIYTNPIDDTVYKIPSLNSDSDIRLVKIMSYTGDGWVKVRSIYDNYEDKYPEDFFAKNKQVATKKDIHDYKKKFNKNKKITESPEKDSDEYVKLCTEIEFQAEDNGFTLTNDDVKAIADKMIEDKFFFTHDIFTNDDDEDAWGEINDLIVNAIESYPNKVEESKNKILDDIGDKIEI